MRVTQSMLSNNMLRNLNTSYGKMSKLQDQIQSGTKITRPSDDPVIAVRGMAYRTELTKIEQYQRNTNEVNAWLDTSDEALDQVGSGLIRVKELVVQAANDTNTPEDRLKIFEEIKQIRLQMQDLGNTKVSGDYIFSGTKTNTPLFKDGAKNVPTGFDPTVNGPATSTFADHPGMKEAVKVDVFEGIQLQMNTPARDEFFQIDSFLGELELILADPTKSGTDIGNALGGSVGATIGATTIPTLDRVTENILAKRADIGARMNRLEMMENRLDLQFVNVTKQKSNNEDIDYAESITQMVTAESIHQAALSTGAKIIQQTLVDFIR
jgi:flagellar hook-associated protein 3 FlgL